MASSKGSENSYVTVGICTDKHTETMNFLRDMRKEINGSLAENKKELNDKIDKIDGRMDEMDARLFKDNGHTSMQTRIDRVATVTKVIIWGSGVVGAALLLAFVALVLKMANFVTISEYQQNNVVQRNMTQEQRNQMVANTAVNHTDHPNNTNHESTNAVHRTP